MQEVFAGLFDLADLATDGSQFDALVEDGQTVQAGALSCEVIATPGHTPACVTWRIGGALFTGDALFMPDSGTGRCDFPKGSAEQLYASVRRLYAMPDDTRIFVGHDYQPGGRELAYETTVGQSKADNIQLTGSTSQEDFVAFRKARDATLRPPRLLFQSVQVPRSRRIQPGPPACGQWHALPQAPHGCLPREALRFRGRPRAPAQRRSPVRPREPPPH